ncbi:SigE family RNA polymerase sigma factor [Kineococcus arenarius]|uniref:SigE family RNA polymerase sigma factor n=1 Tax=unclassified Kineococcus TaxID=2621656 RepID=UPI003D7CA8D4
MRDEEFNAFAAGAWEPLRRTAYLMTGDLHTAEDLVQDVLTRVYVAWPRVEDPGAYARVAMSRHMMNRWRRATRRPRETALRVEHDTAMDDLAAAVALRTDMVAALTRLAPRQRAVVVLRYFEDWSEAQIAAELGIAMGTVKSQLHKGLRRLGVHLTSPPDEQRPADPVRCDSTRPAPDAALPAAPAAGVMPDAR